MSALNLLTKFGLTKPAGDGPTPGGTWTDFSGDATGSPPADWSQLYGVAFNWDVKLVSGAHVLDIGYAGNFDYNLFATWDDTACAADRDLEILAKLRRTTGWDFLALGGLLAGTKSSPTGYVCQINGSSLVVSTVKSSSLGVDLGSPVSVSLDTTDWVWVRLKFDRSNNAIRAKAWQDGDSEPGSWQFQRTGLAYSVAGVAGIRSFYAGASGYQCAYFAYAFDGDPAPSPT